MNLGEGRRLRAENAKLSLRVQVKVQVSRLGAWVVRMLPTTQILPARENPPKTDRAWPPPPERKHDHNP